MEQLNLFWWLAVGKFLPHHSNSGHVGLKPNRARLCRRPEPQCFCRKAWRPDYNSISIGAQDCTVPQALTPSMCFLPAHLVLTRHTQVEVQCHRAGAFSCGAPCGRPLPCGNHACSRPCHAVTPSPQPPLNGAAAASNGLSAGASGCEACSRPCPRPRPRGCPHACPLPCHPGPCPTCSQPVSTPCHCGKCSLQLRCHVALATSGFVPGSGSGPGSADPRSCGKPCHRPLPGCTHFCREPCHPRACPAAKECR